MSEVAFKIRVETGNSQAVVDGVANSVVNATGKVNLFTSATAKIAAGAFAFNQIRSAVAGVASDYNAAIQPGINFNTQMKDLQAITGVTDQQLEKIGAAARKNAKDFGVDASASVEAYKLILSQLGPEIAQNDKALAAMGNNAAILSKQLGGDVAGATSVLTTAMNQYGVSLADPMKASKDMALMMNIMSAAAKEGSAELPQIKLALEQAGMMAKTANVPFNELNAAIQVLDKAGKKGAEGGVAIRNALSILSEGKFMGKTQSAMLEAAGIDVSKLADKSLSLSQRLELLKPIMKDTAAMTLLFGRENVAAGVALVQGSGDIEQLTKKITGTNVATEMAATTMSGFRETLNRGYAVVKDWGISLFNSTQHFLPFIQFGGGAISMVANFGGAMNVVSAVADTKFGVAIAKASTGVLGFMRNLALGTLSLIRNAAVMAGSAVVAVGGYIGSLIVATAAQLGLNAAMYANPIGIVVLGITAAVAAIGVMIYWWNEIWGAIKAFGVWIWDHNPFKIFIDVVDNVFPGFKNAFSELWNWIKKKFTDLIDWFKNTWKSIKGFFSFGDNEEPATKEQAAAMENAVSEAVQNIEVKAVVDNSTPLADYNPHEKPDKKHGKTAKEMATNITAGGTRPTNINVTIHKLQDQIVIQAKNVREGAREAGRQIVEELLMQIQSVNGKASTS